MQRIIVPASVNNWKIVIKQGVFDRMASDGEPVPGVEVIFSQEPEEDPIFLEPCDDTHFNPTGREIVFNFSNKH